MVEKINHPQHYNEGKIECIDAIESALGREGFIAWLRGDVMKYIWRCLHKECALDDVKKARWYLDRLIKTMGDKDDREINK